RQRTLPVSRATQNSRRSFFSSTQEVRKMRSPQTTGEEWPVPGMAVFQVTFSVSDHFRGKPFSALVPSPRGPRQAGQFSARAAGREASSQSEATASDRKGMVFSFVCADIKPR